MTYFSLENIGVSYDKQQFILRQLNLSIEKGELVSLLGPSGCGKTTTLRVIAGLIDPNEGSFILDGEDFTHVPVHKRHFGMVFQSYALFPHLTIFDNIAFGLKIQKVPSDQIQSRVNNVVAICGLEGLEKRYPKQLSGGQRQRVALARALVIEPKLLLLDEPLSNLDAKLRLSMRMEIKRIQQQLGITTVFVTHDQEECFSISDKVAIMNKGIIEQFDTPEQIYRYPKTRFVAEFIGFENFIPVHWNGSHYVDDQGIAYPVEQTPAKEATITIRPEDIRILDHDNSQHTLQGTVLVRTFLGKNYQYEVATPSGTLLVTSGDTTKFEVGETVSLLFPQEKIILLEK